jgi:hypothetical protein
MNKWIVIGSIGLALTQSVAKGETIDLPASAADAALSGTIGPLSTASHLTVIAATTSDCYYVARILPDYPQEQSPYRRNCCHFYDLELLSALSGAVRLYPRDVIQYRDGARIIARSESKTS